MRRSSLVYFLAFFLFFVNGCMVIFQKGRRSDIEKIKLLEEELREFQNAKNILEERLSKEIADKEVRLELAEKGLVITFVAEVLFDSGKAVLKEESLPIMDKVVRVLKEEVLERDIAIEGHTDNEPIKYSPWKSNWELSLHRALSILYYLEKEGIASHRLQASGFGEYRPVASNDTSEGRQLNRRVEIVILPQTIKERSKEKFLEKPKEKESAEEEKLK